MRLVFFQEERIVDSLKNCKQGLLKAFRNSILKKFSSLFFTASFNALECKCLKN